MAEEVFRPPSGAQWFSLDPRTEEWVEYEDGAAGWLEAQYKSGAKEGTVRVAGMVFDIDFTEGAMLQINEAGYAREIERVTHERTTASRYRRRRASLAAGTVAKWRSLDPRTGKWVDYPQTHASILEAQYLRGRKSCKLEIGGASFVVEFTAGHMQQVNEQGRSRMVERVVDDEVAVQWRSRDPRSGEWVDYDSGAASTLEAQFQARKESGLVCVNEITFVVYFTPPMKQVNDQGLCRDVERIGEERKPAASVDRRARDSSPRAASPRSLATAAGYASAVGGTVKDERPALYTTSKGWTPYTPDPMSVLVIGPGAGTRANIDVYEDLRAAGFYLKIINGGSYDQYPPGWENGHPDLSFNHGQNLASLADDVVYSTIVGLVKKDRGPSVLIAGSRGGQVTTPRLWKCGWQGPTVVINAGCVDTSTIPGLPVCLALYTCGQDFFRTKDPAYTMRKLRKEDADKPVFMYHHPDEHHMPSRLGRVLQRLVEVTRDGLQTDQVAIGPGGKQWPLKATVDFI